MALKLYDRLTPSGDFPLVDASDVETPDGGRLDGVLAVMNDVIDENGKIAERFLPETWVETCVDNYIGEVLGGEY